MRKFSCTKKRSIITIILITILTATSIGLWQMNNNVQAAIVTPNPPSGVVGWWRFDEGIGTIATDSSGNGNTGTVHGATWVSGKYGQALNFDGTSYLTVLNSASLNPTSAITIAFWTKIASYPSVQVSPLLKGGNSQWYFRFDPSGTMSVFIKIATGNSWDYAVSTSTAVPLNTWTYFVFTYDGTYNRLYQNGVDVQDKQTAGGTLATTTSDLTLADSFTGTRFSGVIDEAQIFNRALSATEIQNNYQNSPGFTSQLTATIPKGTTQVITTITWQGTGSITATLTAPSQTYTEDIMSIYQKTTYATSDTSGMLNIKRLSITLTPLPADQIWAIALTLDSVNAYQISVEVQK
jgi:hypothetical protein